MWLVLLMCWECVNQGHKAKHWRIALVLLFVWSFWPKEQSEMNLKVLWADTKRRARACHTREWAEKFTQASTTWTCCAPPDPQGLKTTVCHHHLKDENRSGGAETEISPVNYKKTWPGRFGTRHHIVFPWLVFSCHCFVSSGQTPSSRWWLF